METIRNLLILGSEAVWPGLRRNIRETYQKIEKHIIKTLDKQQIEWYVKNIILNMIQYLRENSVFLLRYPGSCFLYRHLSAIQKISSTVLGFCNAFMHFRRFRHGFSEESEKQFNNRYPWREKENCRRTDRLTERKRRIGAIRIRFSDFPSTPSRKQRQKEGYDS